MLFAVSFSQSSWTQVYWCHQALASECEGNRFSFLSFSSPSTGSFFSVFGANVRCWKVRDRVWWVFSGTETQLNPYSLLAVVKNSSGIYKLSLLLAGRSICTIWIEMIIWIISLFPLNIGKNKLLEIKQKHYALHYNILSSILSWRIYLIHCWDPIVRKRLI